MNVQTAFRIPNAVRTPAKQQQTYARQASAMITIRNVSYRIGTHPILDNVSLDIPEGGITALIGQRCGQIHPVFLYGAAAPA
ncbi:hypothetical protein ACR30T_08920 [Neisseria gonorrhoeae]